MVNYHDAGQRKSASQSGGETMIHLKQCCTQTAILFFTSVLYSINYMWDLPGGALVKSPPANAGDRGSSPGPGRSHMPRSNN